MTLTAGTRLGLYTITSPLGAGGMGEVYRARDSRLDRDVAIKVLRSDVASDRERLARFDREARLLAALNHPNIANVIGLEGADGTPALVMELVEGPTLALRIDAGALPLEEALDIARQIAEALEAAHERGIVHRDLKPANVKVRADGLVKVLDFGLAKALDPDALSATPSADSPTITSPAMTQRGVILGTAAYMAPEQAKGRPVDRRADIWACGCVLYEMLTGRRAFKGEDSTETIVAVVSKEPDWTALPRRTPPSIRRLLQRMLVKDPRQRIDSAAVVRLELAEAAATLKSGTTERDGSSDAAGRRRWPLPPLAAAGLIAVAASLATWAAMPRPTTPAAVPSTLSQLTFRQGTIGRARFAPDGQTVVYAAAWDGEPFRLYSTRVGSVQSRSIDLPPADLLALSRDGNLALSIARPAVDGFEPHGIMAVTALAGGAPREMFEDVVGADWSADGKTMALARRKGADRAQLEFPLGTVIHESSLVLAPRISPDGERVCFIAPGYGQLMVGDRGGGARILATELGRSDRCAWSPDGREIWVAASGGGSMHVDLEAVNLSGGRRRLASYANLAAIEDIAPDGKVLVAAGTQRFSTYGVDGVDRRERELTVFDATRLFHLTPNGRRALLWDNGPAAGLQRVFVRALDGTPAIPLGPGAPAALTPDGQWAAVIGDGASNQQIRNKLTLYPIGIGAARTIEVGIEMLPSSSGGLGRTDWSKRSYEFSADGNRLLIPYGSAPNRPARVYVYDLRAGVMKAITPEGVTGPAALSHDGKFVAVNGATEVAIHGVDDGSQRVLNGEPELAAVVGWSADGQSLLVLDQVDAAARLFRRSIRTGERVFVREIRAHDPAGVTSFDVWIARDGQAYGYHTYRRLTNLFVVEGLR